MLYVQCKTPDDGQKNCPKYVEFYSKNKFEKLVHLVGFIIRKHNIYFLSIDLGYMFWIESIHQSKTYSQSQQIKNISCVLTDDYPFPLLSL